MTPRSQRNGDCRRYMFSRPPPWPQNSCGAGVPPASFCVNGSQESPFSVPTLHQQRGSSLPALRRAAGNSPNAEATTRESCRINQTRSEERHGEFHGVRLPMTAVKESFLRVAASRLIVNYCLRFVGVVPTSLHQVMSQMIVETEGCRIEATLLTTPMCHLLPVI